MTRGPADRVVAMLALVRPVVDEILVALDDRAPADVERALASVADRLIRFPYAEPVDRPLAWLHAECAGDWVLTLDDDEVPSGDLIDALPGLVMASDSTHYLLPRRWLLPDETNYLTVLPWCPDFQLRLVMNDRRLLEFPYETHMPIVALGPGRHLELPLYHADCLLASVDARVRKARHYERQYAGKRVAGRALNHAYYLPERRPEARTSPVPRADLALIRTVLRGEHAPASRRAERTETATREEIDRLWPGRPLDDRAYRGRLTLLGDTSELRAGEVRELPVRVENLGDETWPGGWGAGPSIRLGYHWRAGGEAPTEGARSALTGEIRGGSARVVPVTVAAPERPGRHTLAVDLLHEGVRWFECPATADVDVLPTRRVAIVDTGSGAAALREV